ncbi:hypothetical protein CC86DRAFT_402560 [Ophiobolus disseminans]|uniref:C3H1-type domain-containing protein n=1 Tax=Ophiobolus disseminans TaxID=1469910 RepID=A0A6A7AD58_9PLEO|nr:hypothetical protein CC86DRAFT_402560 [Ophiobolus disseminans]
MFAPLAALARKLAGIDVKSDDNNKSTQTGDDEAESSAVDDDTHDRPYVLVLVDAHSHPFVIPTTELNQNLSKSISQNLQEILPSSGSQPYRLHVRVYAHPPKLQRGALNGFNRGVHECSADMELEFISVYTDRGLGVQREIGDAFSDAIKDPRCTHIYLAAWERLAYLFLLQTPSPKVHVVLSEAMGPGYETIPLPCRFTRLPALFAAPSHSDRLIEQYQDHGVYHPIGSLVAEGVFDSKLCNEHLCELPHAPVTETVWTDKLNLATPKPRLRAPGPLPQRKEALLGHIPVNKDGQRLDYYMETPPTAVCREYKSKVMDSEQPCKWHHLTNGCRYRNNCKYDHSELSREGLWRLRYVVKKEPCTYGPRCRRENCIFGHICLSVRCLTEDVTTCPLRNFHEVDPALETWVKVDVRDDHPESLSAGDENGHEPMETSSKLHLPGVLPEASHALPGHIPVNKDGERLDYCIKKPTAACRQAYNDYVSTNKNPCLRFHIAGTCNLGESCKYDHSEICDNVAWFLRYLARRKRCRWGSACRRLDCMYGHVCQDTRCKSQVIENCSFRKYHDVDFTVASWVKVGEAEECSDEEKDTPVQSFWF